MYTLHCYKVFNRWPVVFGVTARRLFGAVRGSLQCFVSLENVDLFLAVIKKIINKYTYRAD